VGANGRGLSPGTGEYRASSLDEEFTGGIGHITIGREWTTNHNTQPRAPENTDTTGPEAARKAYLVYFLGQPAFEILDLLLCNEF